MVVKEFLEDINNGTQREIALKIWKWVKRGVLGVVIAYGMLGTVYTVPTNSVAVVKRFGEYARTTQSGIHLKMPHPIETVDKVPVDAIQTQEFGFRTLRAGITSQYIGVNEMEEGKVDLRDLERLVRESGESFSRVGGLAKQAREILIAEYIMLTGDLNMADVEWIVQYNIKDAKDYLFNIRNPVQTVRDASQAVMRLLIGNGSIDESITIGRVEYEIQAKEELQKLLDSYQTGINIITVKLQSCNPPLRVRPSFNEVNKSLQQKEQRINEAMKAYNELIPKTQGEAKRLIEQANGYAAKRVNEAKGDVAKFGKIYEQYENAPDITRQRMYFETMSNLLPKIPEKWIIEQGGAEGGILLKLNLDGKNE